MSKIQSGCNSDCMNCADAGCSRRIVNEEQNKSDDLEIIEIGDDEDLLENQETSTEKEEEGND